MKIILAVIITGFCILAFIQWNDMRILTTEFTDSKPMIMESIKAHIDADDFTAALATADKWRSIEDLDFRKLLLRATEGRLKQQNTQRVGEIVASLKEASSQDVSFNLKRYTELRRLQPDVNEWKKKVAFYEAQQIEANKPWSHEGKDRNQLIDEINRRAENWSEKNLSEHLLVCEKATRNLFKYELEWGGYSPFSTTSKVSPQLDHIRISYFSSAKMGISNQFGAKIRASAVRCVVAVSPNGEKYGISHVTVTAGGESYEQAYDGPAQVKGIW